MAKTIEEKNERKLIGGGILSAPKMTDQFAKYQLGANVYLPITETVLYWEVYGKRKVGEEEATKTPIYRTKPYRKEFQEESFTKNRITTRHLEGLEKSGEFIADKREDGTFKDAKLVLAFGAWAYAQKRPQVITASQSSVRDTLLDFVNNEQTGEDFVCYSAKAPGYPININKKGSNKNDTEYRVDKLPVNWQPKDEDQSITTEEILQVAEDVDIRIRALLVNEYPMEC